MGCKKSKVGVMEDAHDPKKHACNQNSISAETTPSGFGENRSPRNKKRVKREDESTVLEALRKEGLLSRPVSQAKGGVSFLITDEGIDPSRIQKKHSVRLEKLELRQHPRKKQLCLTEEQLRAKLERAERRRKRRERERAAKAAELALNASTKETLVRLEEERKEKEIERSAKETAAVERRQRRLDELRNTLKQQRERRLKAQNMPDVS